MIKKAILYLLLVCFSPAVFAQQNLLNNFNKEREILSKKSLTALSSYAAANIIYGSIAASQKNGSNKYFHQMNAIWNGVTFGIAAIGYLGTKKEGVLSYNASVKKQHSIEKVFLFNTGLDFAYIAGGAYIKEKSKTLNKNSLRLKGYGESIMLQGGVLLIFDGVMYLIHKRHAKALFKLGDYLKLAATHNGIGVLVKL